MILHVKDAPAPTLDDTSNQNQESNKLVARRDLLLVAVTSSKDVKALAGDDDAAFWQKYVCRGEKLTQACMRNKDTAINFVTAIDSGWDGTMETELKLWGYTDYNGKSMYCELDNIADSLNLIGVDAKFRKRNNNGQNECFNIGHTRQGDSTPIKDQTYQVEGKTYRVSRRLKLYRYD